MKKFLLLPLLTSVLMTASSFAAGEFRHIVLFQFKESTTPEQIKQIEAAFGKLPSQIDTIKGFEWGHMDNVEVGRNQGFTHSFVVTFKDKAGLETYIPHAAHQAFISIARPLIEKSLVMDYVAKD